ncbi:hypothetical protein B0189_06890 [Moraxella cuniculi]|nr:hypothetical protein B0189_06890 [Moraxella cuniculi]
MIWLLCPQLLAFKPPSSITQTPSTKSPIINACAFLSFNHTKASVLSSLVVKFSAKITQLLSLSY